MNLYYFYFIFILKEVYPENIFTNDSIPIIFHWMSSNFGSSFATQAYLHDVNRDNYLDMISISVDGEVMVSNLKDGNTVVNSNWPVYLSNDHFFSKPFMYIHGENMNKELICIISHKGTIYYFDWNGILIKRNKINNIYLRRNWTFIQHKELSEIILLESNDEFPNGYFEMFPEVFADVILADLSVEGVMNDVVIPVTFVTEETKYSNSIVAAILVLNLSTGTIVDLHLLSVSNRDSEYPGYLLSNVDLIRTSTYQLVATVNSGVIYRLQWNRQTNKFSLMFNGQIMYNQGPHNCMVTWYCSDMKGTFVDNDLCCVYGDFFGHLAMIDLLRRRPIWEYTAKEEGMPTTAKIFLDNQRSPFVLYSNNKGWIHCVSLMTGTSRESFPLQIIGESFSAGPEIITNNHNQLIAILISDNGHLYLVPITNPDQYKSIFHNTQISSYLPPLLIQSHPDNVELIIHSKTGFIFKLEIPNFKRKEECVVRTGISGTNSLAIGTLYGVGTVFSLTLRIIDPQSTVLKSTQYYIIRVFINEYLFHTHKELHSGSTSTDLTITIDLGKVNRTVIPASVFIFGTATILVSDATGRTFPPDQLNVRINYDFQYELVWILYVTFFICCAGILLFHFNDSNDKLYMPVYNVRDN